MTSRSGTLRIAKKQKKGRDKEQFNWNLQTGRIIVFSSNRKYNAGGMHYIEGSTDQKKEPVVHELWASDIALEGLLAILSGQAPQSMSLHFQRLRRQCNSKCVHALKFPYSSGLPFDLNMVPVCATFLLVVIDQLLRGGGGANMC